MWTWLKRRRLRVGLELVSWPDRHVRQDWLIVDLSRTADGVVGVRRRRYGVYRSPEPPPYDEDVEFVSIAVLPAIRSR
jgi:hypothetical protein